jgi:hypothetical protein
MRTRLLLLIVAIAPSLALAQAKELKDKPQTTFNEIERGFYIGITAGFWSLINPPANKTFTREDGVVIDPASTQSFSSGQTAQMEIGVDFSERVSAAIFVQATANRANASYTGKSQDPVTGAPRASGDFTTVIPGALVRVGLLGLTDSQDVKRTWFYVRLGAGYVLYQPKALLPIPDVMIFAGPGVEYFTRLRHFSIGLEANFVFMALTQAFGFTVTPMLRYAF